MSDKTTEEAAEEYANDLYPNTAAYNAIAYRGYINGVASLSTTIAQLREENERLSNPWINVKDTLPTESGLVEICLAGSQDIYIAFYKKSRNVFQVWGAGRDPICDMETTHWKPLTKPPMYICRQLDCNNLAVKEEYPGNAYYVCESCYDILHPSPPTEALNPKPPKTNG